MQHRIRNCGSMDKSLIDSDDVVVIGADYLKGCRIKAFYD